jgi:hypothetical protein
MADPTSESKHEALRLDFDRRLMLRFRGSVITSDRGLLAYRELGDVLALTTTGGRRSGAWAVPRDLDEDENSNHILWLYRSAATGWTGQ